MDMNVCDKTRNELCYCETEIQLCTSHKARWRISDTLRTRKRIVKMAFWTRCLLALFLHIGCLAVDHRHRTSELPYEKDDLRLILGQSFSTSKLVGDESELSERVVSDANDILCFQPISLDFKESTVGIPSLGVVRVDNKLADESVKLISISGSTVHFHSSFFADKVISPGSNTTFEVVFLSRSEGLVDSNLYIQTSKGLFKYHVQGVGLPNPYRLRPLVGARIPVNGSYEPLITMHNPHGSRIQVVEILSSGSDFRLSLPEPSEGGEEGAWAIEPFQTKPVMKGTFQGKAEGNHTGYIKIRVNSTRTASEYLLLPVEVQVSSSPGIYSPQESLDFGLLVKTDKPKTLSLSLINAQHLPVNVQSVSVKGNPNRAVRIEFRPISIEQDSATSTIVALVTFDPSEVSSPKDSVGSLEICSDHGNTITIPFRAVVLNGELEYNSSALGFFLQTNRYPTRNFSIRNTFPTAVAIYEVTLSHPEILKLTNFNGNGSQIVLSGEQVDLFRIKVKKQTELCDAKADIHLTLKSNVTTMKLPITCYDGKLQPHILEGNQMKFGRVELYSNHVEYFSVGNLNPVEVRLKSWGTNISWALLDLVGMKKGRKEDLAKIQNLDGLKKSLFLQPGHMAIFSVELRRPMTEGVFSGEAFVTTDHNQTLRVRFSVAVSKGSVHADTVLFDKAFPGKISVEKLHLSSTFNQTLGLRNIFARPEGVPLWFSSVSMQHLDILPHRKTLVGKVHFDPKQLCANECYSGFLLDSPMGKEWVAGSEISWETAKVDWDILQNLQKRFDDVKDFNLINMTLWVETITAKGFKISTKVNYAWPRITGSKVVVFPLTAIGNESFVDIPVYNPTNTPLFVHALMGSDYGPNWSQYVQGNGVGGNLTDGGQAFSLSGLASDSSQSNEKSAIFTEVQKSIVGDFMDTKPTVGVSFVIPPSAKFYLRCRFKPISKQVAAAMLIVRNNLTGVETTWVRGRAGTGLLTLGSGQPGSSLLFQITEKLLQGCEQEPASKYLPPQLTVRRSFLARNMGDIPMNIEVVEIYPPQGYYWPGFWTLTQGESCEGFGFRILNCNPFTLLPNETHSIDIAYTPDFTMSRMVRSLRLLDSNGVHYNYSLVAMVPSAMLEICSTIITRPAWETTMKYILVGVVCCGFVAASCLAYFDSSSIVSQAIVATVRVRHGQEASQPGKEETKMRLDLKSVYENVDSRFKRSQQELLNQQQSAGPPGSSFTKPKSSQNPTQRSPPSSVIQVPSTIPTSTVPASSQNIQGRPDPTYQSLGLRSRKKNNPNTKTAAYLAAELGTDSTLSSAKWIKVEDKEEDAVTNPQRSSFHEDATNNNATKTLQESKKYIEVTGKRKGKGCFGKPRNQQQGSNKNKIEDVSSAPDTSASSFVESTVDFSDMNSSFLDMAEHSPVPVGTETVDDGDERRQRTEKSCSKKNRNQAGSAVPCEQAKNSSVVPPEKFPAESRTLAGKINNDTTRDGPSPPLHKSTTNFIGPASNTSNKPDNKHKPVKQKQLSGSSSSGSHGSASPVDFPSRSGTPRLYGDGFNDGLAQRRSSAGAGYEANQYFTSPPPGYSAIPTSLGHHPPYFYQQQFQNGSGDSSHSQRIGANSNTFKSGNPPQPTGAKPNRRPGVIGQHRPTTTSATTQGNTGFVNGVLTTLSLTMNTNTPTYRQTQGHGLSKTPTSWTSDLRGGGTTGMEGWNPRTSGEIYPSSNNIPFARPPPATTPPSPKPSNDLYNFSSALPNDLISSLWQMNTFDRIPTSASHHNRNVQPSTSMLTSASASVAHSRAYAHSSLSDTSVHSAYQHTQVSDQWSSTLLSSYHQSTHLEQNVRARSPVYMQTPESCQSGPPGWSNIAPAQLSSRTSPFDRSEWETSGNNNGRDGRALTDIWQNSVPQPRPYWPTSITDAANPNRPTSAVTAASHLTMRSDPVQSTGSTMNIDYQREIEAGLGFNPFGSNIWTPSESDTQAQNWSAGGSNSGR